MTDNPKQYFHLSIGPVQGFVSQARRTRDFWSGSFLLSWLSSVAMLAVQKQGGEIRFPIPDEHFLAAIQGNTANLPEQGSVPNRFKALGVAVSGDFDPNSIVGAIQDTWWALAEAIWKADLETNLQDAQRKLTRQVWERQVRAFWQINWCLTHDESISNVLDRRKNWRDHSLPEEPGVKCMMMEGFQELSAQASPHAPTLNTFWTELQQSIRAGNTDLRKGESLCALAFIKRRFVRHFASFQHSQTIANTSIQIHGWPLKPQVPSVLYMAASPWYGAALRAANNDKEVHTALNSFLDEAEDCVDFTEAATPTLEVREGVERLKMRPEYAGVDGTVFHASQLELGAKRFSNAQAAKATLSALHQLRAKARLPEPSAFYAVLLMDGDSLGSQMSSMQKQQYISKALQAFTTASPEIVRAHNGYLVYAGGDDVLALLPVDHAVRCAQALRTHYENCFTEQNAVLPSNDKIQTSLSAAVQFAHIKLPLTFVLNDAHHLLDQVAKNETGRDSLAIQVRKPGGLHLQWSQPWQWLQQDKAANTYNLLSDVADTFALRERNSPFTHKFIVKASALLSQLPNHLTSGIDHDELTDSKLIKTLLQAELLHSGLRLENNAAITQEEIDNLIDPLLKLTTPHRRRDNSTSKATLVSTEEFKPDGMKLLRFLVQNSIALHTELSHGA